MKITYIYHSGFFLETDTTAIIIDFYQNLDIIDKIVFDSTKKLYVLSSHSHYDHFSTDIIRWGEKRKNIKYILSKDIQKEYSLNEEIAVWLEKGDIYKNDDIYIKAFGSTDVGISFLIKIEGKTIFHAGDLNNWHWMEESTEEEWKSDERRFLEELEDISKEYQYLDIVMFPMDSRLGTEYMRGAVQFIDKINVGNFFPMHFGENYNSANNFHSYCNSRCINFFEVTHKGQTFNI